MPQKTCVTCGKAFDVKASDHRLLNCSMECRAKYERRDETVPCQFCGKPIRLANRKQRNGQLPQFCDRVCFYQGRQKRVFPRRRIHTSGYVEVWLPGHPRAHTGYVFEHILVAEGTIGRPLTRKDEVHHVNHNKQDNRPENLAVLTAAEHAKLHYAERSEPSAPAHWRRKFARQSTP